MKSKINIAVSFCLIGAAALMLVDTLVISELRFKIVGGGLFVVAVLSYLYTVIRRDVDDTVKETLQRSEAAAVRLMSKVTADLEKLGTRLDDTTKGIIKDIPDISKQIGRSLAEGASETPYAGITESVLRNKIGIAAVCRSLIKAETVTDIVGETVKGFSMLGLEARAVDKLVNVLSEAKPDDLGVREEGAIELLPVAVMGLGLADIEIGDQDVSKIIDKASRNVTNTEKVVNHIKEVLTKSGIINDPNQEKLFAIAAEVESLKGEFQWMVSTLASNGNDFCKMAEMKRLSSYKKKIDTATEQLNVLVNVAPKLKGTMVWTQINHMIMKSYDMMAQIDMIQKTARFRIVPVGVCIFGAESQIGKSELAERLIALTKEKLAKRSGHRYTRVDQWGVWRPQVRDEFDTGYVGQEITYQDDAFAGKDNEDHAKWLNFISPSPIGTVQAQLNAKGAPYRSVLCVTSCNQLPITSLTINNVHALHERFPITINAKKIAMVPNGTEIDKDFKHLDLKVGKMTEFVNGSTTAEFPIKDVSSIADMIVDELLRREAIFHTKLREEVLSIPVVEEQSEEEPLVQPDEEPVTEDTAQAEESVAGPSLEPEIGPMVATNSRFAAIQASIAEKYSKLKGKFKRKESETQDDESIVEEIEQVTEENVEKLSDGVLVAMMQATTLKSKSVFSRLMESREKVSKLKTNEGLDFQVEYRDNVPGKLTLTVQDHETLMKLSSTFKYKLRKDLVKAKSNGVVEELSQLQSWWKHLKLLEQPLKDREDMSVSELILLLPKLKVIEGEEAVFADLWSKQSIVRFRIGENIYFWGPRLWGGSKIFIDCMETEMILNDLRLKKITVDLFNESIKSYFRDVGICAAIGYAVFNPMSALVVSGLGILMIRSPEFNFLPIRGVDNRINFANIYHNIVSLPVRFSSTVLGSLTSGLSAVLGLIMEKVTQTVITILGWLGYRYDVHMEGWLHKVGRAMLDILSVIILCLIGLLVYKLVKYWKERNKSREVAQEEGNQSYGGATRQGKVVSRKGKIIPVRQEAEERLSKKKQGEAGSVVCEANEIVGELLDIAENMSMTWCKERNQTISFYWSKHYGWAKETPDFDKDYNKMLWDAMDTEVVPREVYPDPHPKNNRVKVSQRTHYLLSGVRGRSFVIDITAGGTQDEVHDFITSKLELIRKKFEFCDLAGVWESCSWEHPDTSELMWFVEFTGVSSVGVKESGTREELWTRKMLAGLSDLQKELEGVDVAVKPADVVQKLGAQEVVRQEALIDVKHVASQYSRRIRSIETGKSSWGLTHLDWIITVGHTVEQDELVEILTGSADQRFILGRVILKNSSRDISFIKALPTKEAVELLRGTPNIKRLDITGPMRYPNLSKRLVTRKMLERSNNASVIVWLPKTQILLPGKMVLTGEREYVKNHDQGEILTREWMHIQGFEATTNERVSQVGDCGGAVFLRNRVNDHAVIGIHSGSTGEKTYASILTVEDIQEVVREEAGHDVFFDLIRSGPPMHLPKGDAIEYVGRYAGNNMPIANPKCSWSPSPWRDEFDEVLVPPPLLPNDERIEVELPKNMDGTSNLVMKQVEALTHSIPKMDQEIIDYAVEEKVKELSAIIEIESVHPDRDVMLSEALNGHINNLHVKSLNIDASAGLPWTDTPGMERKDDHIERLQDGRLYMKPKGVLEQRVNYVLDTVNQGERPIILVASKLKDQLIKMDNVRRGKVRVYHCVSVEKIVADAALFGHFKEGFLKRGQTGLLRVHSAVGQSYSTTVMETLLSRGVLKSPILTLTTTSATLHHHLSTVIYLWNSKE